MIQLETIDRNINRLKDTLRSSGHAYGNLIEQLNSAEADLTAAEDEIKNLESPGKKESAKSRWKLTRKALSTPKNAETKQNQQLTEYC